MPTAGESEPTAAADDAKEGAAPEAALHVEEGSLRAGPVKRGAALRRELVAKLPPLAVAGDSGEGKRAMSVDPGAVDLDADAFIGPLHTLVSEGRG